MCAGRGFSALGLLIRRRYSIVLSDNKVSFFVWCEAVHWHDGYRMKHQRALVWPEDSCGPSRAFTPSVINPEYKSMTSLPSTLVQSKAGPGTGWQLAEVHDPVYVELTKVLTGASDLHAWPTTVDSKKNM